MTMALQTQETLNQLQLEVGQRGMDNYTKSMTVQVEFINFLDEMELDTSWTEWPTSEIKVIGLDQSIGVSTGQQNDKALFKDTLSNTGDGACGGNWRFLILFAGHGIKNIA